MQDINFAIDENEVKPKQGLTFRIKQLIFKVIVFFIVLIVFKSVKIAISNSIERRRYKKIIKKGLFWDTEYLIEK